MASPAEPDLIGWYELGPRPGEPSNAILAGHVNWNGQTGAFNRLHELKPGDTIEVKSGPDLNYQYVVESIETYPADKAPVAEIFGETPQPTLTLITCGGKYDANRQAYEDRVVVRAQKVD
jgi:LPXTG-site transpeptidase (sortase) family protein